MSDQQHARNPGNFAADREKASRAGHIGGQHSSGNFAHNPARAAEAGRRGGERSHGGGGAERNPGNFAQDRERAAVAGRKGGQHSHGGEHRAGRTVDKPSVVPLDRKTAVETRIREARDSLPGRREGLPEGALGQLPADPQGDENREPPANAPTIPP